MTKPKTLNINQINALCTEYENGMELKNLLIKYNISNTTAFRYFRSRKTKRVRALNTYVAISKYKFIY